MIDYAEEIENLLKAEDKGDRETYLRDFAQRIRSEAIEECAAYLEYNHTGSMASLTEDVKARAFAGGIRLLKLTPQTTDGK